LTVTAVEVTSTPTNDKEIVNKDNTSTEDVTDKQTAVSAGNKPEKENTTSQDNKRTLQHDKDGSSKDTITEDNTQVVTSQHGGVEDKDGSQSAAEVSMEVDELVVHTIDEDDFKMEEQSRSHASKKSRKLPTDGAEERVSYIYDILCHELGRI